MALDLRGKRVTVLGLGLHGGGVGVTKFLVAHGADVTVTDLKTADQLAPSLEALRGLPVRWVLGEHRLEDVVGADMVVRNPGVPAESPYLAAARAAGVPVEMEMGLFFQLCPAPIIAVTGTKGKSTTTLLIASILRQSDPRTVVAGNLRISALELLPEVTPTTPVVLELSSWQLEGLEPHRFSPHIAVITNISEDHLNRYPSFEAYARSKTMIFRWQRQDDALVLNYDNAIVAAFAGECPGQLAWFSRRQAVDGAYVDGDNVVWRWRGQRRKLCDLNDIRLSGEHNVENVLAACAAACLWGATPDQVRSGVRSFGGAEHRLEHVRTVGGLMFYNDTTATTPRATIAALQAVKQPVILIAGGADKNLDFGDLAQAIVRQVKALILLEGSATDRLEQAVRAAGGQTILAGRYTDLRQAVARAREAAARGDVVLLSPACASFGLFTNEIERGETFKAIVASLS